MDNYDKERKNQELSMFTAFAMLGLLHGNTNAMKVPQLAVKIAKETIAELEKNLLKIEKS